MYSKKANWWGTRKFLKNIKKLYYHNTYLHNIKINLHRKEYVNDEIGYMISFVISFDLFSISRNCLPDNLNFNSFKEYIYDIIERYLHNITKNNKWIFNNYFNVQLNSDMKLDHYGKEIEYDNETLKYKTIYPHIKNSIEQEETLKQIEKQNELKAKLENYEKEIIEDKEKYNKKRKNYNVR